MTLCGFPFTMSTIHNNGPDVGHRWTKAILKHWQLGARKHVASYDSKFLLHLVTRSRNLETVLFVLLLEVASCMMMAKCNVLSTTVLMFS